MSAPQLISVRFKYRGRGYTAYINYKGEAVMYAHATRRFYDSNPHPIAAFMPVLQERAREALAKAGVTV
jgi:hypothetical protein